MRTKVHNLQPLLQKLQGHLEKGNVNAEEHPSGQPRGWVRPKTLESMEDSDTVESYLWTIDPTPNLPRKQKRLKQGAAGRVAILRDTSMSMQGMWNLWASLLCTSVTELAKKQKMRVGYIEFNSRAQKFTTGSDSKNQHFFMNDYQGLALRMSQVKVEGLTNYEAPLSIALDEFESIGRNRGAIGRLNTRNKMKRTNHFNMNNGNNNNNNPNTTPAYPKEYLEKGHTSTNLSGTNSGGTGAGSLGSNRTTSTPQIRPTDQHILFITDGQPTSGDRQVRKELERARQLGVSVHTVFIGYRSCPSVLDRLSLNTYGSRWASFFCPDLKAIQIVNRDEAAFDNHGKDMELRMVDRMTRMPTVFQRYLDENNVAI